MTRISVTVDGDTYSDDVEPRMLLVHYLRERLGKTGTVVGCDTSNCGACTVHLGGRSVKSCNVLAVQADGEEVTTIEGLAQDGELHPMQSAFRECHALQCGYCTPGMIMQSIDLLNDNPKPSEDEIRVGLEGNLCRCTGYHNIIRAVQTASGHGLLGAGLGGRGGTRLHLRRRVLNRSDDVLVAGAAAEVALEPEAHLLLAGIRVLLEQVDGAHDHARRAVAALEGVLLVEGTLHGMELAVLREALDRRHLAAVGLHREHGARLHGLAVDVHGAGAAVGRVAADVRPGQAKPVAQELHKQHPGLDVLLDAFAVDRHGDRAPHA